MNGSEIPARKQTTRLLAGGKTRGYGTLLLYPDKLAAVSSGAVKIGMLAGFIVVFVATSLVPPHTGPGALGGLLGAGGGYLIAGAIARSQAAAKVAARGDNVAIIPLESISSLQVRKSRGWLAGQYLSVTTADGAEYGFGVKLDQWSADLTSALAARGRVVRITPEG